MTKSVRLRENSALQCGEVNDAAPVIPRVKIIGWQSLNRRQYLPESVSVGDYENLQVNLNHPDGPNKQRLVQERFGWFENVTKEADGAYGDLHYNPELPYAKAFAWWAKNKPDKVGMSHDAVGTGTTKNGVFIVEKCHPKAVDLVADPASTKGLYESMEPEVTPAEVPNDQLDDLETHIKNAVGAICADDKLTPEQKTKKIKAALKLLEEPEEKEKVEEEDDDEEDGKKAEESLKAVASKNPAVKKLVERLDTLETKNRLREKSDLASRLCQEAKLPSVAMSERFLETLIEAKDEKDMKALIADRKALATVQKPRSTGPVTESAAISDEEWLKRLKG